MNERKPMGQHRPLENVTTQAKEVGKPPRLSREVQARLGQQLRAMYDEIVNQGVPTRFVELLNRIDRNGSKDGQ
jgi:hypothetical protein